MPESGQYLGSPSIRDIAKVDGDRANSGEAYTTELGVEEAVAGRTAVPEPTMTGSGVEHRGASSR